MWKHSAKDIRNTFSLHDCRATRIFTEQNDLYFEYNNGFWICPDIEHNPNTQTLSTDKSQIKICNHECSCVYVFEETCHLGKCITQRISLPLETFMNNINSGKWELEFLYEYHAYREVLFECLIWSKNKPYNMECQLQITCDDIEYFWNNICEDKPW